jgi:hypothetical protein
MECYPFARLLSVVLFICAGLVGTMGVSLPNRAAAQETPVAAPAAVPATAAPTTPSEKPPAAAAAATPEPAHPNGQHIVLLLPQTFTEYQNAVSGLEVIPDWTNAARKNLDDAALDTLQTTGTLQLEPLPALTPEESTILHDHIAIAELIVSAGVQYKNSEWHKHRDAFDRRFGDGLRFLHERTGADYALLIDGTQVRQSGGRIAMRLLGTLAAAAGGIMLVPTGGGGEVMNMCLLDLNHGTVAWFNSSRAIELFGSSGADLRNAEAAKAAMRKLFASYPTIPALAD